MSHKKKNPNRGWTWRGLAPKFEPTKKERIRKMERKHKKDLSQEKDFS